MTTNLSTIRKIGEFSIHIIKKSGGFWGTFIFKITCSLVSQIEERIKDYKIGGGRGTVDKTLVSQP